MANLIDRYLAQVGEVLPAKERADVLAELRSLIQDQLEDRYPAPYTPENIASVLKELGSPSQIARSYQPEQYLISPKLYPTMSLIIRHGWILMLILVLAWRIFIGLIATEETFFFNWALETVEAILLMGSFFSVVIVAVFALIERLNISLEAPFDPFQLSEVTDPRAVNRVETTFAIAFGTVIVLGLFYLLATDGVSFGQSPELIQASKEWLALLAISGAIMVALGLFVIRRNRWDISTWVLQVSTEVFAQVCLYFALLSPLFQYVLIPHPTIGTFPLIEQGAVIILFLMSASTLFNGILKLIKLLS